MKERAKQLAGEHWDYISSLLATHGTDDVTMEIIGFHYNSAAIHFHGHGVEDQINRARATAAAAFENAAPITAYAEAAAMDTSTGYLAFAANAPLSLCATCAKADVSCPIYPQETQQCVEFRNKAADPRLEVFDLVKHLHRQRRFSEKTFGPGARTKGVLDHIRKELEEIESDPADLFEWVDLILLALDGAWRSGNCAEAIAGAINEKQSRNEKRTWPNWKTADPDKAIEHVRILADV